jgi:1-acyl-sn-glycerol-3-phosphate acyltransferase
MEQYPKPIRFVIQCLQYVWFAWAALVFTVTGLVAALCYFLIFNTFSGKKAQRYTFVVTKIWAKVLLFFLLVRIKTEGQEQLDPEGSYVMVSNHLSAFDIPVCMHSCTVPFSFLAKIEADRIPIVGYLARHMHLYVDRKSAQSRQESYVRMVKHLQAGKSIHIYPEGTRNKTQAPLLPFHDGAFRLAIETQRPIVVLTIVGSNRVMGRQDAFQMTPGTVYCLWSSPISTEGLSLNEVDYLKEKARNIILHNLANAEAWT